MRRTTGKAASTRFLALSRLRRGRGRDRHHPGRRARLRHQDDHRRRAGRGHRPGRRRGRRVLARLAGFVLDAFAGTIEVAAVDEDLDRLTEREREVMRLIARGYSYKEVGSELFISIKTVETHMSSVLRKLQLSSRHELTRWAADRRLLYRRVRGGAGSPRPVATLACAGPSPRRGRRWVPGWRGAPGTRPASCRRPGRTLTTTPSEVTRANSQAPDSSVASSRCSLAARWSGCAPRARASRCSWAPGVSSPASPSRRSSKRTARPLTPRPVGQIGGRSSSIRSGSWVSRIWRWIWLRSRRGPRPGGGASPPPGLRGAAASWRCSPWAYAASVSGVAAPARTSSTTRGSTVDSGGSRSTTPSTLPGALVSHSSWEYQARKVGRRCSDGAGEAQSGATRRTSEGDDGPTDRATPQTSFAAAEALHAGPGRIRRRG